MMHPEIESRRLTVMRDRVSSLKKDLVAALAFAMAKLESVEGNQKEVADEIKDAEFYQVLHSLRVAQAALQQFEPNEQDSLDFLDEVLDLLRTVAALVKEIRERYERL